MLSLKVYHLTLNKSIVNALEIILYKNVNASDQIVKGRDRTHGN
jgi:hypothetical protein